MRPTLLATASRHAWPVAELVIGLAFMLGINATAILSLKSFGLWEQLTQFHAGAPGFFSETWRWLLAALGCNAAFLWLLREIRNRVLRPLRRITQIMRHASTTLVLEQQAPVTSYSLTEVASLVARFTAHAQEAYTKCNALEHELAVSRQMLAQIVTQQQAIAASTNRELIEQYHSVVAYASYLDEHISSHQGDAQLRYDFDDVCESGFNLKLIAQSLELLRQDQCKPVPVPLASLLQQTLIALAPSLERRAMQLSTSGVEEDLQACADLPLLAHALWMLLLGTIRYAAAESTLRLRCVRSQDNSHAILSIVISELAPGQLTPEERHAHLLRQMQHMSPHMFAETIRMHANAQLAEMMLAATGGQLQVLPITPHACEISLILPRIKN